MNNQKNHFLTEYLKLIATLNESQKSLFWWATDISSKNRFATNLVQRLEDVYFCRKIRKANPPLGMISAIKNILRWMWHYLRTCWRVIYIRRKLGKRLKAQLKSNDSYYLLKSFIYPRSFVSSHEYKDAFLGPLPEYLKKSHHVLIIVDVPAQFKQCVQLLKDAPQDIKVVPWEFFLTFQDLTLYTIKGLFYKPKKVSNIKFKQEDLTSFINQYLKYGRAKIQPYQLYHYAAFKRIFFQCQVSDFLLTHESNPWERMCIVAAREMNSKVRIVGYQHNVIPQASANMFIDQSEIGVTPLPDQLITTGKGPYDILKKYSHYPEGMVKSGCALRIKPFEYPDVRKPMAVKNVLVAMEGVHDAGMMATYVIDQLKNDTSVNVTFRTHPVLPWSYYESQWCLNIGHIKHFHVSNGSSLEYDISLADVVVYWGSTVGMEALGAGKPVIHFKMQEALSYDPLFEWDKLKWIVAKKDSLKQVIKQIEAYPDDDYYRDQKKSIDYLNQYFFKVSPDRLRCF